MQQVELHQIELRYAALRINDVGGRARLLASLAQHGQRSPVLVTSEPDDRFVLIDGYARVAALRELGRDLVATLLLDLDEADALVMAHRLEAKRRRSALEEGWLILELIERHGLDQRSVAERLQRSVSWISRRLALVQVLPEVAQAAVRCGRLPAHAAEKYLVPLARAKRAHCEQLVTALGTTSITVREMERLYLRWKKAGAQERAKIAERPLLLLKADAAIAREPVVHRADPAAPLLADLDGIVRVARRARRRLEQGVLKELDETRRDHIARSGAAAQQAVQALCQLLETQPPCSTSTPAPQP